MSTKLSGKIERPDGITVDGNSNETVTPGVERKWAEGPGGPIP